MNIPIKLDFDSLQKALGKATPGPWPIRKTGDAKRIIVGEELVEGPRGYDVAEVYSDDCDYEEAMSNAIVMSEARTAMPEMMKQITELKAALHDALDHIYWMSAASDFRVDGQAHVGWAKVREDCNRLEKILNG